MWKAKWLLFFKKGTISIMNLLTLQAKVIKRKKKFLNWNVEGVSRADPTRIPVTPHCSTKRCTPPCRATMEALEALWGLMTSSWMRYFKMWSWRVFEKYDKMLGRNAGRKVCNPRPNWKDQWGGNLWRHWTQRILKLARWCSSTMKRIGRGRSESGN